MTMGKKDKKRDANPFGTIDIGGGPDIGGPIDVGGSGGFGPLGGPDIADPLGDLTMTDDLAADSAAELTALESEYRARAAQEQKRFVEATDSEFWFAVCFKTRDDKDAFLIEHGIHTLGDKYIDGHALDRKLKAARKGK